MASDNIKPYVEVERQTPFVEITFTGNRPTKESFNLYLDELTASYEDRNKIALLFDARKAVFPGLKYIRSQAFWMEKNWNLMNNYCVGTAYIISSFPIRIALRIIFSFQRQPVDFVVVKSKEEAYQWLKKQFSNAELA